MAMSLDGFVARKNHGLDWLMKQKTEGEDHGYEAFQARMDGIVMGRGSYQNVLSFGEWPYTKPVIVMSKTLQQNDVPKELADKVRGECCARRQRPSFGIVWRSAIGESGGR